MSFVSAILFGTGYLLAAFTYKSGATDVLGYRHERGWPLWVMVLAFIIVGLATTCMYISAINTCAKNFGRGKYRGLALACPIAAFGLSGMWLSQVGSRILYERTPDGKRGDVDVFRFFLFLAVTLPAVGLLGTFLLKIVDEDELIDHTAEELERSGLLEDSEFLRRANGDRNYGSSEGRVDEETTEARRLEEIKSREEEARKKNRLLNAETRHFLQDRTMWLLAGGFLLVSGTFSTMQRLIETDSFQRSGRNIYNQSWYHHWNVIFARRRSFGDSNLCCYPRLNRCHYFHGSSNPVRDTD
jgi:MFS family permease